MNSNLFSQSDTIKTVSIAKLEYSPNFHSIQIDGNIFVTSFEIGGQLDFDLFRSQKNICIGTRFSIENYMLGDFGGTTHGSPFTNYNLYLRLSNTLDYFTMDVLGGMSYYESNAPDYYPNQSLPRIGFELKYGNIIGIILKGSTSFKDRTGFFGIGLSLGYNHFL